MERSEYYTKLASIVVGSPCVVSIHGERTIRDESGEVKVVVIPEKGMAMGILADLMERRQLLPLEKEFDGKTGIPAYPDIPPIHGIDDNASVRFLLERISLYRECGHLKYPPIDMSAMSEIERLICGVLEDKRAEALLSEDFPALSYKFKVADRLLLGSALPYIMSSWNVNDLTATTRVILLSALMRDRGMEGRITEDPVVRRTAELIAYIGAHPQQEGAILEAMREIHEIISRKAYLSSFRTNEAAAPPRGGMGGEGEGREECGSIDGCGPETSTQRALAIDEDVARAIADISRDAGHLENLFGPGTTPIGRAERNDDLIDRTVVQRTADILRQIRGSIRSYNEILRDEGYALDIQEVIQLRAGSADARHLYYTCKKERPEFDMAICLDKSASMDGARIQHAKESTANLVRALELVGVNAAIIAYDEMSIMLKPWDRMVDECGLNDLTAGGGTSISQALQAANELLKQRGRDLQEKRRQAIIVVSDGHDYYLEKIAAQIAIARRRGIRVFYIGIGEECRRFIRIGANHFRYDHSVIIDRSEQIGEALVNLARVFIREM
ncbi:MAG: VWA domain-containing protein [Euryarchaeota archaeon]|nr:VWA domain-containing protein [Euryarchaeota archaeon]